MGYALSEVKILFQGSNNKNEYKWKNKKIDWENKSEHRLTYVCSELEGGIVNHWRKEPC